MSPNNRCFSSTHSAGGMTMNDVVIMRYKKAELKQAANEGNFLSLSVIK